MTCSRSKACRRCREGCENTLHVLNNCKINLQLYTSRHNNILDLLTLLVICSGLPVSNDHPLLDSRLRPDLVTVINGQRVMIDVTCPFDTPASPEAGFKSKIEKYHSYGTILPLVVGSLGSWWPQNDDIKSFLPINGHQWNCFRQAARLAAIKESLSIARAHLSFADAP